MNKRVKELAEQAETKEVGYYFFDKEKFAELIIQECIERITRMGILNNCEDQSKMACDELKEHFGVAE